MRAQAKDPEKFDQMVKFLSNTESKEDLVRALLLYVMDLSYDRADICLAEKAVLKAKGW